MAMLHLRVVFPREIAARAVVDELSRHIGVVAIRLAGETSDGWEVRADLARECADGVLDGLRALGVHAGGMITLEPLDTVLGTLAERAEADAPGEGADAVIWDDLAARTGEDSTLTWSFVSFMVLATILAGIGVVTDSTITIVGAMVVGPEFGPLAGLAVAVLRRRIGVARKAALALLVGFPVAIVVAAAMAVIARATGLYGASDLTGHSETEFLYQPGWFSIITALVAGAAGMLSITSSKSAALVGVFISVTTIPAAGNAAVAAVVGDWHQSTQSLLVLAINLVGIVVAGVVTLAALEFAGGRAKRRRATTRAA